jgi:hypothetical protein
MIVCLTVAGAFLLSGSYALYQIWAVRREIVRLRARNWEVKEKKTDAHTRTPML